MKYRSVLRTVLGLLACLNGWVPAPAREYSGNDLSYESYIDSNKRIKCLYGYAAEKIGDHEAARLIFEDCIRRWNDVYSMIWLADMYETGAGVPKDPAKATALIKQGAESDDEAGYGRLARFHYGVALYEGRGVERDPAEAIRWLRQAAREGIPDALDYLRRNGVKP
jgi:TPR repeat protein